jgi:hypothetical protein
MKLSKLPAVAFDYVLDGLRVIWLHGIRHDGVCTCGRPDCSSPGKHPVTRNGVLDATTSLKQLKAWSKRHPDGNVGIATGPGSDIVVLDIDPDHDGRDSLNALEAEHGPLPVTPTVETGGGGEHQYYRLPEGVEVRNRAGIRPGIDSRGLNGYVVAPPSRHASGGDYGWAEGLEMESVPLAELPGWLLNLIAQPAKRTRVEGASKDETIAKGTRNATLASRAGTLRRGGLSEEAIATALLQENEDHCDPPLDEGEVRRIAKSIGRYDPAHTATDRLELAGLAQLPEPPDLAVVSEAVRNLVGLLDGADSLERETTAQAAVSCLKDKGLTVDNAKKLMTAAIRATGGGSQQAGPAELLANPQAWPEPVDGVTLLDDLMTTIHRFVIVSKESAVAITLWIAFSHSHDAFGISPLLGITSPTMRCGKSTLLELLLGLVPRGLAASNVSPAAMFRAVDQFKPTLIVDEADSFMKSNVEYINILNSSWKRPLAVVIRCVGDNFTPTPFSTWGPKVVALIGQLPPTLDDRSIEIRLERKLSGETIERIRPDRAVEALVPLQRQLWTWAQAHLKELATADPEVPETLDDRAQDNWRGLIAIGDTVGGGWGERARGAALALDKKGLGHEEAIRIQLLEDLFEIFDDAESNVYSDGTPVTRLASSKVLRELHNRPERPWADFKSGRELTAAQLARLLRPFGIRPKPMHLPGSKSVRGYEAGDFSEVFERYLGMGIDE